MAVVKICPWDLAGPPIETMSVSTRPPTPVRRFLLAWGWIDSPFLLSRLLAPPGREALGDSRWLLQDDARLVRRLP